MDSILKQAQEVAADCIALRRKIHRHPELADGEFETTKLIQETLGSWGIEEQPLGLPTGAMGIIRGEAGRTDERVTLLRADIDALPMQDRSGVPYASSVPGVSHACGHDGHVAILLGAGRLLAQQKSRLTGTIKLLFQPAEETGTGSHAVLKAGILTNPTVDCAVALHGWPECQLGHLGVFSGAYMASADSFTVTFKGGSAHGAYPHRVPDALNAAAHGVTLLNEITSRRIDAKRPAVLSVCMFHAGTAPNIIPEEAVIAGTIRTQDTAVRQQIQQEIHRVVQGIADANGCSASVAFQHGPAPLVNSHEVIQQLKAAWSSLFGPDSIDPLESVMSSEDFSDILSQVGEGAFVRLGITKEGAPLHHIHTEEFDFNDEAIVYGIALLVKFIMDRHGGQ